MCLDIVGETHPILQIAEKDKVVYKYVESDYSGALRTPYQGHVVKIGETVHSQLELIADNYGFRVNVGIHSLYRKRDAMEFVYARRVVVKCIIPKGSYYYVGKFRGDVSYASDRITYVEIVKQ